MKTFSEKYINKSNILRKAIVGFEFEFCPEKSYYKFLEFLNREIAPYKVQGFRQYHSEFKPEGFDFKMEPDLSLGADGAELITSPLSYYDAKIVLTKILKVIDEFGKTDEKCSIHVNISFDREKSDRNLDDFNYLKLILNIDEDLIYQFFPNRRNNHYAKSVKKLIPFKDKSFSDVGSNLIQSIETPNNRYYGVNIQSIDKDRIEFRYIGGKDYHKKTAEIIELMDYFILLTWDCLTPNLTEEDKKTLMEYLEDNINNFKHFQNLENFIAEFPSIKLQIDKREDYELLKTYYTKIYDKLYDVITNIYNLEDCIINFDTVSQKMEIVDAEFKVIFDVKSLTLVECIINGGTLDKCTLFNCQIKNSHINKCTLQGSIVTNSKLENSTIDITSEIYDCYVEGCKLDGKMCGGIFRSGKIGESAELDDKVEIVAGEKNYFDTTVAGTTIDKKGKFKDKKDSWLNK